MLQPARDDCIVSFSHALWVSLLRKSMYQKLYRGLTLQSIWLFSVRLLVKDCGHLGPNISMYLVVLFVCSLITTATAGSYGIRRRQSAAAQTCLQLQKQYSAFVSLPNTTTYDDENTGRPKVSRFCRTTLMYAFRILECPQLAVSSLHRQPKLSG